MSRLFSNVLGNLGADNETPGCHALVVDTTCEKDATCTPGISIIIKTNMIEAIRSIHAFVYRLCAQGIQCKFLRRVDEYLLQQTTVNGNGPRSKEQTGEIISDSVPDCGQWIKDTTLFCSRVVVDEC